MVNNSRNLPYYVHFSMTPLLPLMRTSYLEAPLLMFLTKAPKNQDAGIKMRIRRAAPAHLHIRDACLDARRRSPPGQINSASNAPKRHYKSIVAEQGTRRRPRGPPDIMSASEGGGEGDHRKADVEREVA